MELSTLVYFIVLLIVSQPMSSMTMSIKEELENDANELKKIEEEGSSRSIYPFISCQHCDTFLQCFLRCPFAEYPGLNRLGIYVPEGLRGVAHIMGYRDDRGDAEVSREKLGRRPILYKHKYKNYKPFNPTEIKEKYLYANRKDKQKRSKRRTK